MIRTLATTIALGFLLACGGASAVPAGDAGDDAGGSSSGGSSSGGSSSSGSSSGGSSSGGSSSGGSSSGSSSGGSSGSSGGAGDAGDGGVGEAGSGALGSPCSADNQCAGGLCLGGVFVGGYCTEAVSECDPGLCSNASVSCEGYGAFQDVDGGALATPEICPALCQTPADCRSGYQCCHSNAGSAGLACLPPSLCGP